MSAISYVVSMEACGGVEVLTVMQTKKINRMIPYGPLVYKPVVSGENWRKLSESAQNLRSKPPIYIDLNTSPRLMCSEVGNGNRYL